MASDPQIHHGVVHGKTIELEHQTGLPDGQPVRITVLPIDGATRLPPGEGLRRSAGGWSDDPAGLDEYLGWSRQQRKTEREEPRP